MEKEIRRRFTDDILEAACGRYHIAAKAIRLLDGFESFIYEFDRGQQQYILRISHSRRRTLNHILGEIDWINYLAAGGAGVARAVPSRQGNWVEAIADRQGGHFLAAAFIKAPGGPAWEQGFWQNEPLLETYGRLLGRMHRLSQSYQPAEPGWKRPEWDDPIALDLEGWLPPSDTILREKLWQLLTHLRSLPKDRETYGLIHQDAHAGNFFIDDEGHITLFDFDDCVYGWYVYDLAMVLFYAITNRDDADEFGSWFWHLFMRGYQQECQLDPAWLSQIPYFMKLRELDIYALLHRSRDISALNPAGWDGRFMAGRRERILHEVPCLQFELKLP